MAAGYVSVESDDRVDNPSDGLEFKSFLPSDGAGANETTARSPGASANRGYRTDAPQSKGGFWTVEYYQHYFDVDTKTVLERCYSTLLPTSANYLATHLTPAPDLYGPFWTLTTLIFTLFVSSSLASSITSYLSASPVDYDYDFKLLSIAVTLVYSYGLGFPVLLWASLKYLGVGEWNLVEAVAVWGYGQFVWIPVSILCVIPVVLLRWILVGLAFGFSGYFLVANIYPILASAEAKATRLIVVVIVVLHAAIALTFKVLFFSYYVVDLGGPVKEPLGGSETGVPSASMPESTGNGTARW